MEKLCVAGERVGLFDRIDDHRQFANRALRAHGPDGARNVFGLREKIADHENHRAGRGGQRGRQRGLRRPPESLVARDRFGEALDDALRRQGSRKAKQTCALAAAHAKIRESQRQQGGPVDLRDRRQNSTRIASRASDRTRSRPYARPPIRARARKRALHVRSDASRLATTARQRERAEIARRFRLSPPAAGHERRAARSALRDGPR